MKNQKRKAGKRMLSLFLTGAIFFTIQGISVWAKTAGDASDIAKTAEQIPEKEADTKTAVDRTGETGGMPQNPVHHCTKKDDGTDTTIWSYVYFGSYPQSEVTGNALTSAITGAAYDANGDAWVNGTKYRRMKKSDANHSNTGSNYFYWNGDNDYHYFKWERIKWRVLSVNGSTMFVTADKGLDCKNYHDPGGSVTWETCTLRNWLNNDFCSMAFSSGEQGAIVSQKVVNEDNPDYGIEGGNDTTDKVYLLSRSEVTNPEYGFCEDYIIYSVSRRVKSSDYAHARGVFISISGDYAGNCGWWLRSPGYNTRYAASVGYEGFGHGHGSIVHGWDAACVPALHINLSSDLWSMADDGTSGEGGGNQSQQDYKVYRSPSYPDGYEIFDCSLETCMKKTPSVEYNPQLAHMLIAMCNSVYNQTDIEQTFLSFGFQEKTTSYTMEDGIFLSYGMAKKKLDNGKTLLLVVARGTEELIEWISNLDVDVYLNTGQHQGFSDAANALYCRMEDFLKEGDAPADFFNTEFVITGFSRGAAAANILSCRLADQGIAQSQIYAYTFACPDTALITEGKAASYYCIFNIADANDFVSWVPRVLIGNLWNKYGRSYWYSNVWEDYGKLQMGTDAHNQAEYLSYLRSEKDLSEYRNRTKAKEVLDHADAKRMQEAIKKRGPNVSGRRIPYAKVLCPVDVEIYASDGRLAGTVKNNVPEEILPDLVYINVYGDQKHIFFLKDDQYTLRLTGTDSGIMEYTVQNISADDWQTFDEKIFANVILTDGKCMTSTFAVTDGRCSDTKNIRLFVLDDAETPVKEVLADGSGTEILLDSKTNQNGGSPKPDLDAKKTSPKATSIQGRIKAKSRAFLVKWKKQTDITGYQIQYSTNKKFKKKGTKIKTVKKPSATKLTVRKLKPGRKYYVRIRTYKTVNGAAFYSDWSKTKTVNIKK